MLAGAAGQVTGLGGPLTSRGPSHLLPHLRRHAPPPLLEPLVNGKQGPLKHWNAEAEAQLLARLRTVGLSERIVRVGVLDAAGIRLAAVKLQAGDWETGVFSLRRLNRDAVRVLETCFSPPTRCDHVDVWAAVPYTGPDGIKWHWPVFSVSCWRDNFLATVGNGLRPAEILGRVSTVRYDPLFLRHTVDRDLPPRKSVFSAPVPNLEPPQDLVDARGLVSVSALVRGPQTGRMVAITIDDGPHPVVTPLMLHILRQAHVRATFFLVGEKILQYPQLFLDILAGGHQVGNHGFTNRRLATLALAQAAGELHHTSVLMERLGHERVRIMRPAGGEIGADGLALCGRLGLTAVFWTKNTGDWQPRAPAEIARAALYGVRPGDIILMHQGRPESALALREIVAGLQRIGLRPVRIEDLAIGARIVRGSPQQVFEELKRLGCLERE